MSKVNLTSQDWCDIVFDGRNKSYGAYRLRANLGKRQLRAIIIVLITLIAILILAFVQSKVKEALKNKLDTSETVTEFSQLKKEEPKKEEEKKIEKPKEEPKIEKVAVKASIQFTVPKVVDDDQVDKTKELKTQKEVTKSSFAVASQNYEGDSKNGINIDDLKDNQRAGGDQVPKNDVEKVVDNAIVDVPATYPGGEAALLAFINHNLKYPEIALEQGLEGTAVLRFKVGTDGSVSEVVVRKSLSRECDQAAIKVIKRLNRFIPAKTNGHPVPVWYTLPVKFQMMH